MSVGEAPRVLCPVHTNRRAGPSFRRAPGRGGRDPGLSGLCGSYRDHRSDSLLQPAQGQAAGLACLPSDVPAPGCSCRWDSASWWTSECLGTSGTQCPAGRSGLSPGRASPGGCQGERLRRPPRRTPVWQVPGSLLVPSVTLNERGMLPLSPMPLPATPGR